MLVKEIATIKGGKRLPKGELLTTIQNSHPYIRVRDINSRYIKLNNNFEYVPDEVYSSISNYLVKTNDVVLSIVGTIGLVGIVDKSLNNANLTENCVKFVNVKNYDNIYLYYYLSSQKGQEQIKAGTVGSTQPKLPIYNIEQINLPDISIEEQRHIVDTIGSVDDLIENIEEKSQRVKKYGNKLFSKIRLNNLESLLNKVSFSKGKEIGSLNYLDKQIDDSVPYIRVGDLLGGSFDTFTTSKNVPLCNEEDILITFDGAPGRNNYGLKGAISSGVQKVICKPEIKGFIYFYINSDLCQNTIQSNAQGTTILHASKAIKELKIPVIEDDNVYQKFNDLFSYLIVLSKEKTVLQKQKQLLLQKYFG